MERPPTRLLFVPTGKVSSSEDYKQISLTEFKQMQEVTGYVLTPTGTYSVYQENFKAYTEALDAQIKQMPDGKPYYIGIPVIDASDVYQYNSSHYTARKAFVIGMNNKYGGTGRLKGFYFTNERVFGTVSASSPVSNAIVKLMNDLAYTIRNDPNSKIYKEFIWAPYLGYNSTYYSINQNLGIVANRTNIFNTIYLQSGHFFTPQRGDGKGWNSSKRTGQPKENLDLARKCARENKVFNYTANNDAFVISSTPVGGSKTSTTKIAIDVEAQDELKRQQATYAPLYESECEAYEPLLMNNACPFVFYAGSYNGIVDCHLYLSIDAFYLNGSCRLPV